MGSKNPDEGGKKHRVKQIVSVVTGTIVRFAGEITVDKGKKKEQKKVVLQARVVKTTPKTVTICLLKCPDLNDFEAWMGGRNFPHQVTIPDLTFGSLTTAIR